jgi:hypothetical protein
MAIEPDAVAFEEEAEPMPYSGNVELPTLTVEPIVEEVFNHTLITQPLSGIDWSFLPPVSATQLRIQEDLAYLGHYVGKQNGDWGDLTAYAIGEAVGHIGDSIDKELCILIQGYAAELGNHPAMDDVKGVLTAKIWEAFALGLATLTEQR